MNHYLSKYADPLKRAFRFIKEWLIIPLLISPLLAYTSAYFKGPSQYNLYFVGNFSDRKVTQSLAVFKNNLQKKDIRGVPVRIIAINSKTDDSERTANSIRNDEDAIMVIGHFNSTSTSKALPSYIAATPKIPVILPVESNPNLLTRGMAIEVNDKLSEDYKPTLFLPILRLAPTDDLQADKASEFIEEIGAQRIWIIEDVGDNPLYVRYLANELADRIDKKFAYKNYLGDCSNGLRHSIYDCSTSEKWAKNTYHARIVLRSNFLTPPPMELVNSLNIDWVILVSSGENCVVAANQIRELHRTLKPRLNFMTLKGCEQGLKDKDLTLVSDTFLTHYVTAHEFNADDYYGYSGLESATVLNTILNETEDRLRPFAPSRPVWESFKTIIGIHSAKNVRSIIASIMYDNADSQEYTIDSNNTKLKFHKDGKVEGKTFKIWKVNPKGEGFIDLEKIKGDI